MKISVVISTYNGEKFIKKQLQSILNQTLPPDEVIINDDNSKDNTVEIIRQFVETKQISDKWKWNVNCPNKGCYVNFISGALNASGDIIFFCDQDDIWHKEKIEKMARCFESKEDMLACYCLERYIDQNENEIKHSFKRTHNVKAAKNGLKKVSLNDNIKYNKCPGLCLAFRKELLYEVAPFILKNELMHDLPFGNVAALKNGLYVLNEELVNYRQHSSNLSAPKLTVLSRFKNIDYQIRGRKGRYRQLNAFYQEYAGKMDRISRTNLKKEIEKIHKSITYLEKRKALPLFFQMFDLNPMDNRWIAINNFMCVLWAGRKK